MMKASAKTMLFLFPILVLIGVLAISVTGGGIRATPPTPVAGQPVLSQFETELKNTQTTVRELRNEFQRLKETIATDLAMLRIPPPNEGMGDRLKSNWDMLTITTILAILVGGVCGVFLAPLLRRRHESSQHEQLLELTNQTAELKKQSDHLNGRLGLVEGLVKVIHESLLIKKTTETTQPDNETVSSANGEHSEIPPKPDRIETCASETDTQNGSLLDIGVVPPSEYVAAVTSSTVVCKTTTTNQDFRYPGKLIEAEGGRFLILSVNDGTGLHNLALPASDRLLGSDEFTYYYKNIFDCEQPISGEIYVIAPARMDEDTQHGGWMLHSRGKLQIRR